jgi:hypothetical protein
VENGSDPKIYSNIFLPRAKRSRQLGFGSSFEPDPIYMSKCSPPTHHHHEAPKLPLSFKGPGGAEFYSENIVKRTDVICSVYDRTDLFLYRVFGLVFSYHGRPELITGQVEVSHNIVINAKQNIKPMSEVLNVNEISY